MTIDVACPYCQAQPGDPCRRVFDHQGRRFPEDRRPLMVSHPFHFARRIANERKSKPVDGPVDNAIETPG